MVEIAAFLIFTRLLGVISRGRAGNGKRPGERPFSNVQAYFHEGEHCEHLCRDVTIRPAVASPYTGGVKRAVYPEADTPRAVRGLVR